MNDGDVKDVGIWIRVSTDEQAKGDSPKNHQMRAEAYAEAKGWNVVTVYDLSGVSGKNVLEHPEAGRMLLDIKEGRISGLIFSKLARLARNTKQLLHIAEVFQKHDAGLISLEESIDTSTPSGRFFFTLLGAMASWEREEISSRIKAAIPNRVRMGKSVGGKPVYGYMWTEDKELVPDPDEVPVRILIYETFLKTRQFGKTAQIINDKGYRTRAGKLFKRETIKRLITDTTAKGIRIGNRFDTKHRTKDKSEWVEVPIEAIVSETLWNKCNDIVKSFSRETNKQKHTVHLFSGYVYCSECNIKMYKTSVSNNKYRCRTKGCRVGIDSDALEEILVGQISDFIFDDNEIANYLGGIDQQIEQKQKELETIKKNQEQANKSLDALIDLYSSNSLTKSTFHSKATPLEEKIAQMHRNSSALQGEIDHLKIAQIQGYDIVDSSKDITTGWKVYNEQAKRRIIESVLEKVTVSLTEIDIALYSLPFSKPNKSVAHPYG